MTSFASRISREVPVFKNDDAAWHGIRRGLPSSSGSRPSCVFGSSVNVGSEICDVGCVRAALRAPRHVVNRLDSDCEKKADHDWSWSCCHCIFSEFSTCSNCLEESIFAFFVSVFFFFFLF